MAAIVPESCCGETVCFMGSGFKLVRRSGRPYFSSESYADPLEEFRPGRALDPGAAR